jgi:uncharacterized protein YrrD
MVEHVTTVLRASELRKKPVVTFAGEAAGVVTDVLYATGGGSVAAFAIGGGGLLSGGAQFALPWAEVAGFGPAAVMIRTSDVLVPIGTYLGVVGNDASAGARTVTGGTVLTDTGEALGQVTDVLVALVTGAALRADVVGYEIAPSPSVAGATPAPRGARVLIPVPDTMSVSAQHLVVPAAARSYLTEDLGKFDQTVARFRAELRGGR